MARPMRASPDRILAAAAAEFARRGYSGARVDRIARRAGVNKAMLYYHFRSKQALYRTILGRVFRLAGERLQAIASSGLAPDAKIDRVIALIATFVRDHDFFPSIMLREIAERGAHLDRDTLAAMAVLPQTVARIVQEGVAERRFRPIDPLAAYFIMLPPILFYLAGAPIRKALSDRHVLNLPSIEPEAFVRCLQQSMRLALGSADPMPAGEKA
jgi:AcrR family transcriptional regulator